MLWKEDPCNPLHILWRIYAEYLRLESNVFLNEIGYKEEMTAIIMKLEMVNDLAEKLGNKKMRTCILYFLGYFYYKNKDIFASIEKFKMYHAKNRIFHRRKGQRTP